MYQAKKTSGGETPQIKRNELLFLCPQARLANLMQKRVSGKRSRGFFGGDYTIVDRALEKEENSKNSSNGSQHSTQ